MNGLAAIDIEQWAQRDASRADFPRLLCWLICGTCRGVTRLDIPGGEHMFLSGIDGIIACDAGNAFVPSGVSAWELSTEANVKGKADRDYQKRTACAGPLDKSGTAFVFATPRRWASGSAWASQKHAEGVWREVRSLSSASLATWIDSAPWLADAIRDLIGGEGRCQIKTARALWEQYSATPCPMVFDDHFILHGRNQQRIELTGWLSTRTSGGDRIIRLGAPSQQEALHFVASCIHSLASPHSLLLGNRVLFIEDANAVHLLRHLDEDHVVMVGGERFSSVDPYVKRASCKTILVHQTCPGELRPVPSIGAIEIPPLSQDHLVAHLVRHGYQDEMAIAACVQCAFDYAEIRKRIFLC